MEEQRFKALIVWLIANGKAETALVKLADHYDIEVPKLRVGLPKGRKKQALGCYTGKNKTISVLDSEMIKQPFVVLHEFYHCMRTGIDDKHRGTEKYADDFANDFLRAYRLFGIPR